MGERVCLNSGFQRLMLEKQETEMVAGAAVSPKAAKAPTPKKDCKRQNTARSSVKQSSLEMAA